MQPPPPSLCRRLRTLGTGLYTSPHLLEVTERVRCDGKPITKEAFARYFFQVWDRLQTTSSSPPAAAPATAAAGMPAYFHLLTLVGLWCFVREGVDVCVLEVGMGGRFDATNVVPSPVACGVTMLDLDHTQASVACVRMYHVSACLGQERVFFWLPTHPVGLSPGADLRNCSVDAVTSDKVLGQRTALNRDQGSLLETYTRLSPPRRRGHRMSAFLSRSGHR